MEIKRNKNFQWVIYGLLLVILFVLSQQYMAYVSVGKSTVPIMDYWRWIRVFGESVLDGTITFKDYFSSDVGEHIQPVAMAVNFSVLKHTDFDVQPLVEIGSILRVVLAFALVGIYLFSSKKREGKIKVPQFLVAIIIFLSVINYNQWELAIEPFSLANIVRVATYYITFSWACWWVTGVEQRAQYLNWIHGALIGLSCALTTLLVGGAYFVGHLVSIGLVFLYAMFRGKKLWKKYFGPMFLWGLLSFAAALTYYILLKQRGTSVAVANGNGNVIFLLLEGICLFWGALFIPTKIIEQYGNSLAALFGAFAITFSVYVFIAYLNKTQKEKSLFPVACFLYAFIQSVVISLGRIDIFGISVMGASRYVVESSIGWVGVIWMAGELAGDHQISKRSVFTLLAGIVLSLTLLIYASRVQIQHAPYIRAYYQSLEQTMRDIDMYADKDLTSFQANDARDVRYCVDFFEENNLSIFNVNATEQTEDYHD